MSHYQANASDDESKHVDGSGCVWILMATTCRLSWLLPVTLLIMVGLSLDFFILVTIDDTREKETKKRERG